MKYQLPPGAFLPTSRAEMESLGVQPWAGTGVKDEETTKAALDRGAYLITTNHPDKVLEALRKFGKHR